MKCSLLYERFLFTHSLFFRFAFGQLFQACSFQSEINLARTARCVRSVHEYTRISDDLL
uniref:Uncharacterized protein n=1 Tax=Anguilla anguilla TaxID=7936 RepID=A0A0E9VYU8_ANGAN